MWGLILENPAVDLPKFWEGMYIKFAEDVEVFGSNISA